VEFLSAIQCHLLRSAVTLTKPGGVIVYSTCTLSPEENERVIDWVLNKEPGAVQVEAINLPLEDLQPGILRWERAEFSPQVRATIRILPSELLEGFYVATLRKQQPRSQ
jgi:16S rRNA (cytosine1407-C5)-methyltransferase